MNMKKLTKLLSRFRFKGMLVMLAVILAAQLLVGCNQEEADESMVVINTVSETTADTALIRKLNTASGRGYSYYNLLDDGSLICAEYYSGAHYYRYYYESDTLTEIGVIEDFALCFGGISMVQIGSSLYFIVTVEKDGEGVNRLFSIDTDSNTISAHPNDDASLWGLSYFRYGDYVATLKNVVDEDNMIYTFVDLYDPEEDVWQKAYQNIFNNETKEGSAIVLIYGTEEYLYLLTDIYSAPRVCETYLKQYDLEGNELASILVPLEVTDYTEYRPFNMCVADEYFYLGDISNFGYIGKINGTTIEPVYDEAEYNFVQAIPNEPVNNKLVFFIRQTNKCYVLDIKTGEFSTIELELPEDRSICSIIIDGDTVMINCFDDSSEKLDSSILYITDFDSFLSGVFAVYEE